MTTSALDRGHRLKKHARKVRRAGRYGDTHLVHVNDAEMQQMSDAWGEPTINPETGLPEHNFFSKLGKTANFMHKHVRKVLKGGYDAVRGKGSIFGGTPLGTKLSNAVTGRHDKPITDQYGGATPEEKAAYKEAHGADSLGFSSELHQAGSMIGSYYAAGGLGHAAGAGAGSLGAGAGGQAAASAAAKAAAGYAVAQGNKDMNEQAANADGDFYGAGITNSDSDKGTRKKATQFLLGRATALADRPYTPYTGQRTAGLSANEQRAVGLAGQEDANIQSDLDNSRDAIRRSQLEFNADNLKRYEDPYTDVAVQRENEDYDRSKSALLNSKAGAWGGDRVAFEGSELDRQHKNSLSQISADAYKEATNAFFSDADRQQRAASAWQQSAGNTANMNRQQIQDLMATGGLERAIKQADLDFNYNQFVEARDWDVNNLEPLIRTLGTTGSYKPKDHQQTESAAIGAAATIAGAYFNASGNNTPAATTTTTTPSNTPGDPGFQGPTHG